MAKYKLSLPKVVLAPVLALLRARGFDVTGFESTGFKVSDFKVLPTTVGGIKVKQYTFTLTLNNYSDWVAINQEMQTYQFKNLMNGNFEPELAELMRTDKSFVEAVKRLQALWKVKDQALDPLEASPHYPDGSLGQVIIDPPTVNYPVHGE